ncbi:pyruvate dehydrogenase (acetyl-transferring) E1 component subunit alpha [Pueribacillus sp. YX66]|uniref:pyruvate dehydrogenase (acetyl-transferring) E1 component subunit alpha n=1 Tax=Pueribacillus sp. YX66 TaxID=3229242 RepID=UPI00358D931B
MYDENDLKHEFVQLLTEDGTVKETAELPNLTDEQLVDMYEWMVKMRLFDEKMLRMQRQGRIGTYAPFSGQEAAQIGSAYALRKHDWIFPSYREMAACMVHGYPMKQAILYMKGHLQGGHTPEGLNIFPVQIIIAGQTLHAAGCAMAAKLKGEDDISVSYFGDGATSQGDFHEALNIAAVNKAPVIFFCQNNHWAISVPLHLQTASQTIAQKAVAYGMKGVQVDGNDILAVYNVMQEAVKRARNGEGPMLIEAVTYRQGPHTTADDPTKYRDVKEVKDWVENNDPLRRFHTFLQEKGLMTEVKLEQLRERFNEEIEQAVEEAEAFKPSTTDEAFDYVYDKPHKLLIEQKQEVQRMLAAKGGN